jgi:hypothetical protein
VLLTSVAKKGNIFLELSNKMQAWRIFYTGSKANKDLFTSQGR